MKKTIIISCLVVVSAVALFIYLQSNNEDASTNSVITSEKQSDTNHTNARQEFKDSSSPAILAESVKPAVPMGLSQDANLNGSLEVSVNTEIFEKLEDSITALREYHVSHPNTAISYSLKRELVSYGSLAVPFLSKILEDTAENKTLRRSVVGILDDIHDPSSIQSLSNVASDFNENDENLRLFCINALSKFKDKSVGETIAYISDNEEPSSPIKGLSLRSLFNYPTFKSIESIEYASRSSDPSDRWASVSSLDDIIINGDENVKNAAIKAAEDIGSRIVEELSDEEIINSEMFNEKDNLNLNRYHEWIHSSIKVLEKAGSEKAISIIYDIYERYNELPDKYDVKSTAIASLQYLSSYNNLAKEKLEEISERN